MGLRHKLDGTLPRIAVLLRKVEPTSQQADFLTLSVLEFGSFGAASQLLEWIFGTATTAEEKGQKCERASHLSWGLAYDDDACLEFVSFFRELVRCVGQFGVSNVPVCSSQSSAFQLLKPLEAFQHRMKPRTLALWLPLKLRYPNFLRPCHIQQSMQ